MGAPAFFWILLTFRPAIRGPRDIHTLSRVRTISMSCRIPDETFARRPAGREIPARRVEAVGGNVKQFQAGDEPSEGVYGRVEALQDFSGQLPESLVGPRLDKDRVGQACRRRRLDSSHGMRSASPRSILAMSPS